jgi:molecular chaperone GrpE
MENKRDICNEDVNCNEEFKEKTSDEQELNSDEQELNCAHDDGEKENETPKTETIDEQSDKLEELNNRYMRLQADFVNYKKRIEREKKSIYDYALEDIIMELLPVIDNFERALLSVEDEDDGFYKGMKMIYSQLIEVLNNSGLEEIHAVDEKFDPNYHHAVFQEESDEYDEGTVMEVFQKGYKLNDKVIRPSMVKVAK